MDLIYVAYNSKKWLDGCFKTLLETDYDKKKLNIYIVDNKSTDDTVEEVKRIQKEIGHNFGTFELIENSKNAGFGEANNIGFARGNSDIVCFLNIDTETYADTLKNLEAEIDNSAEDVALWELRQFPYEHPKFYDPLTGETSWSSGAAFAVKRTVFEEVNGFDEKIFMYAEDVDLSWRIRSAGYQLKYCPKATIKHYSYEGANEVKPNQFLNSIVNNLLLRYRFAGIRTWIKGHLIFWKIMKTGGCFPKSRKLLFQKYMGHFASIPHFFSWRLHHKHIKPLFLGMDYEFIRRGAFHENQFPKECPKVSIIVRTCGRPDVLRETLITLRNQTYENIEVVVVEDGPNTAGTMIENEFADLNIKYFSTGKNVGRSKAGNLAMEAASGKYLNFLDDDDLFFADHVEVLVNELTNSENRAAYALAFETPIIIESKSPYKYQVMDYDEIHKQAFDKVMLCHHNYIPIQCIMFEKSLFEEYGGLDETLDALEDWDLWVRYSLHTDFGFVDKTTSIYRVPHNRKINAERQKALDEALVRVREKHKGYEQTISVNEIAKFYDAALQHR